ncbi:MAG: alanine racemase [FCB group bacterium]|nr:alanine racemase [FCB group bacterium]MBL7026819.1 alanine racemase [Candidatus Neomarinimicrobiota bacterium]MBL7121396.1 alanine racemase [Candidatus Neomarinimicrobiota bacterium]
MEAICQVSLEAITQNYIYFQKRVNPAQVIPIVKANAYGHGALEITRHLYTKLDVQTFAVATLEEAQELAAVFPAISILIFSRVFPSELDSVPDNAILTVGSMEDALALSNSQINNIRVHLNINTGMNRLGLSSGEAIDLISMEDSQLQIEGVYSHFSSSDTTSKVVYSQQNSEFDTLVTKILASGFQGMNHIANSAAGLQDEQKPFDAIRLGIGLYGYDTTADGEHQAQLQPAMTIKAPLIRVARIQAGESVSYAEKWQSAIDTNIGTLRIGYADGYNRALTNRGVVAYQGKTYPVVGTVTMDHIMIDLGLDEPQTGALFEVMGGEFPEVRVNTISKKLTTIPYEICSMISPRVKRQY